MGICFKCEREVSRLFDSISSEGIVGLCEDCLDDDMPRVKKPSQFIFDDENKERTVRERLSRSSGINPDEHVSFEEKEKITNEQDEELREFVNKRIQEDLSKSLDASMLVRNFHWVIMRARRLRKMTISELAQKISEPKEVLVFVEQGRVSEKNIELIKKLELFFGIQLFTNEGKEKIKTLKKGVLFDSVFSRAITIDDLKSGFSREKDRPKNF